MSLRLGGLTSTSFLRSKRARHYRWRCSGHRIPSLVPFRAAEVGCRASDLGHESISAPSVLSLKASTCTGKIARTALAICEDAATLVNRDTPGGVVSIAAELLGLLDRERLRVRPHDERITRTTKGFPVVRLAVAGCVQVSLVVGESCQLLIPVPPKVTRLDGPLWTNPSPSLLPAITA